MNYEHYLFSNLLKLFDFNFDSLPYDEQFDLIPDLYKEFENSIHNNPNKGLYECIVDYLKFRKL